MSYKTDLKYDFPLNPRRPSSFQNSIMDLVSIISLLKSPSSQRSLESIKSLKSLSKNIPFFKQLINDYEEKAHIDCCMCLKYLMIPKDEFVCKAGDIGDLFYIILQGAVKVLVPNESGKSLSESTVLVEGCSFGEYALIKNKPRSATILCVEDTHFAVLCKKDFMRILGNFTNRKFDEMAKFLKSLPIFSG